MTEQDSKASTPNVLQRDSFIDLDPEFTLDDLLTPKIIEQLQTKLSGLLSHPASIISPQELVPTNNLYPIRYQITPIAYLQTDAPPEQAAAATGLVEAVIYQAARYHLAAEAHYAVVLQDYQDLQGKHQQLQESEARYRILAEQLEQRVQDQVQQIELRQRQVYAAEKLSALAQLGAGVAHEINNPLGFIQSNLNSARGYLREISLALAALAEGQEFTTVYNRHDLKFTIDDLHTLMQESQDGVSRVARIVKDLKGFAGTDVIDRQPVLIRELLASVCNLAQPLLSESIQLVADYQDRTPTIVDKAGICQAIYAVVLNAIQSIADEGSIHLLCTEDNHTINININDTGGGMDATTLDRIYDPFFTTKPVGTGTGLGMTVCRDIVLAHQGTIKVTSTLGQGSSVRIELPIKLETEVSHDGEM